ncbi:MAG: metallophosphoesterase [Alysiella sp.]|uniref:metallophosphoesterase n=1 Tax=Alysiella sp. TaxID=1872483 RepID=UPI0026DA86C9|nr:metallophosphoesterase [Alysiella sp.]MDO4433119.1 metallophosphoesterase [Alysiella sp.]
MSLIQNLPAGSLDVVGDVHGQFEALQNLLHYLGYRPDGSHPQGRKLVFVGDLADRGPDSPAVFEWFRQAYRAGNALMVLGNHELNLLNREAKDGSGWFFHQRAQLDEPNYAPWSRLPENGKQALWDLLKRQPIILQRADLRIVHAAWLPNAVSRLLDCVEQKCPSEYYGEWDDELNCCIKHAPWFDDYLAEQRLHAHGLENPSIVPPLMPATAAHDVYRNSSHPMRALVCGTEKAAAEPFFAGGRWRFSVRDAWWDDYRDNAHVIVGHYWRPWFTHMPQPKHRQGMFDFPSNHWHGARKNVFCIDFSVGARWRDRKRNIAPTDSQYRLAAMRWPEKILVFDNGETVETVV